MSFKPVYLEINTDLETQVFSGSITHSDNSTNFTGSNNKLQEIHAVLNKQENKKEINEFTLKNRIIWHFNLPLALHVGGIWKSTVRIFKHHLRRVVGNELLKIEEFKTFTTEKEAILNSRPFFGP